MRALLTSFTVALLLVFAVPAMAQGDVDRAQKLFDDGAAFYLEGEYGKALLQFRKAQAIIDNPVFMFNIALTEHKLGNTERARDAAAQALATNELDTGARTVAQGLLNGSDRVLEAQRAARNIARANQAVADAKSGDDSTTVSDGTTEQVSETSPPEPGGFGALGWTGVALTAVGAGGLIASGMLGASAQSDYDVYQDTTASYDARIAARDSLEDTRPLGIGLMIGGGVLAATGVTLIVIDLVSGDESEPAANLTVSPTRGGGSVGLHGRF